MIRLKFRAAGAGDARGAWPGASGVPLNFTLMRHIELIATLTIVDAFAHTGRSCRRWQEPFFDSFGAIASKAV